jgi:hypothetical protein
MYRYARGGNNTEFIKVFERKTAKIVQTKLGDAEGNMFWGDLLNKFVRSIQSRFGNNMWRGPAKS